jgi:hypothetical protein
VDAIPTLRNSRGANPDTQSGIHSCQINPSRTLLATGARHSADIAIYRLPTLDPICIGENAHRDWVFDMCWLDDQFLVSGSRDTKLALWRINEDIIDFPEKKKEEEGEACPTYAHINSVCIKDVRSAQKIRAVCFNKEYKEIALLSLNGELIRVFEGLFDDFPFSRLHASLQRRNLLTENVPEAAKLSGERLHRLSRKRPLRCRLSILHAAARPTNASGGEEDRVAVQRLRHPIGEFPAEHPDDWHGTGHADVLRRKGWEVLGEQHKHIENSCAEGQQRLRGELRWKFAQKFPKFKPISSFSSPTKTSTTCPMSNTFPQSTRTATIRATRDYSPPVVPCQRRSSETTAGSGNKLIRTSEGFI